MRAWDSAVLHPFIVLNEISLKPVLAKPPVMYGAKKEGKATVLRIL